MDAAPTNFTGGVFHPEVPDGRAGATIALTPVAIRARTREGRQFELPWTECQLDLGGASGRMVFCRSGDGRLTVFCEDRRFLSAARGMAGPVIGARLDELQRGAARRRSHARALWLGAAVAAVALVVGAWYGLRAGAAAAVRAMPMEVDHAIGDMAWKQMDPGPVIDDETVAAAVTELVDRLDAHDGRDDITYQVHVVRSDTVNAFALPGGIIVVYTGLLAAAERSDQVAGVLAHEMAHVIHRHGLQQVASSVGLVVAIEILVGDAGGLIAVGAEVARVLAQSSYSRDHEREADERAVRILHRAAIDPHALASFFALVDELHDGPALPHWASTHPGNRERITAIERAVAAMPARDYEPALANWQALRHHVDTLGPSATPVPNDSNEE